MDTVYSLLAGHTDLNSPVKPTSIVHRIELEALLRVVLCMCQRQDDQKLTSYVGCRACPYASFGVRSPLCFLQTEIALLGLMRDPVNRTIVAQLLRRGKKLEVPNDENNEHAKLDISQTPSCIVVSQVDYSTESVSTYQNIHGRRGQKADSDRHFSQTGPRPFHHFSSASVRV